MKNLLLSLIFLFSSLVLAESLPTLTLEKSNTAIIVGEIDYMNLSKVMDKMLKMDQELKKNIPIFLVLDTPGGDVSAGIDFITFARGLNRPIHTINMMSISMGFQIMQALDNRYVMDNSIMMSHNAYIGGIAGQLDGQLESRLAFYKSQLRTLDEQVALRMGITYDEYKKLIKDEFWTTGNKAVSQKVADLKISIKCGKSLSGTHFEDVNMFGMTVKMEFSDCPLIRGPLSF